MDNTTVVIVAKNAEATIKDAINSAICDNPKQKVILVDDFSDDNTIENAESLNHKHINIIRPKINMQEGIGNARQTALENLTTTYGVWLDADDEFLPNRVGVMKEKLISDDLDILFDSAVLFEGNTNEKIKDLIIPQNLFQQDGELFLFQRNFLPGPNWHFFRTARALEVGYDKGSMIAEDHDFNLRAVVKGLKFGFSKKITYKQKSFLTSFSRDIDKQLQRTKNAILKHDPKLILSLLEKSVIGKETTTEIMINFFLYRTEYESAMNLLENLDFHQVDSSIWKMNFYRGTTALLLSNTDKAKANLIACHESKETPETLNNLGCLNLLRNESAKAKKLFEEAIKLFPDYYDAIFNLKHLDYSKIRVTRFPLRHETSRSEYFMSRQDEKI
jgi:glycosyltransferase involved in cell wall biosynthesis